MLHITDLHQELCILINNQSPQQQLHMHNMMSQQPPAQPPQQPPSHQGNPLLQNQPLNMQHAINAVMHAAALHNGGIPNVPLSLHHHGNHPLFPPPHPPSLPPPQVQVAGNHGNNVAKQPVRPNTADHTTAQQQAGLFVLI